MAQEAEEATAKPREALRLHSGAALKFSQIHLVTKRSYTPIIFLSGEIASGKTTLLGSIHDAFQFGSFAGYMFAGSETLMAFEERCFEARARSMATRPHTPRTRYEAGQEYFHLKVRKIDSEGPPKDVLFADMSGEFYERAIQSAGELTEFGILQRSNHLVLLLDGEKLLDSAARQKVRNDGTQFVRRCREAGLLRDTTNLQIMISKWDLVLDAQAGDGRKIEEFVKSKFNASVLGRPVSIVPIASRPAPKSHVQKLFGVEPVFQDWVETVPHSLCPGNYKSEIPISDRLFDRVSNE